MPFLDNDRLLNLKFLVVFFFSFDFTLTIKEPNFDGAVFSEVQNSSMSTTITNNSNSFTSFSNGIAAVTVSSSNDQETTTKLNGTIPDDNIKQEKTSPCEELAHACSKGGVENDRKPGTNCHANPAFEPDREEGLEKE